MKKVFAMMAAMMLVLTACTTKQQTASEDVVTRERLRVGEQSSGMQLTFHIGDKIENPPVNMPMGTDSVDGIRQICADTVKAMDEIRPLAATTNY